MEIGETERIVVVEPLEYPFEKPVKAPAEPAEVEDPELVPA